MVLVRFPQNLGEDAEGEIGISGREVQAADEAAYFFLRRGSGPPLLETAGIRFQIATGTEGVEHACSKALEVGRRGGGKFIRPLRGFRIRGGVPQADGQGPSRGAEAETSSAVEAPESG